MTRALCQSKEGRAFFDERGTPVLAVCCSSTARYRCTVWSICYRAKRKPFETCQDFYLNAKARVWPW